MNSQTTQGPGHTSAVAPLVPVPLGSGPGFGPGRVAGPGFGPGQSE